MFTIFSDIETGEFYAVPKDGACLQNEVRTHTSFESFADAEHKAKLLRIESYKNTLSELGELYCEICSAKTTIVEMQDTIDQLRRELCKMG